MRVLVTGGAGFIGASVVGALLAAGHEAGVVDDLSTGKVANLHEATWLRQLDILEPAIETLFREFAPDAVVHLAAQASVPASIKDPDRDWAVNAEGTRIVARCARMARARRVISASSAAVYGDPETVPLAESAPTVPLSPYGCSKLAAESHLAEELCGSSVDFASFRFSNVYGPRQDAEGEGGVVAIFLDTAAKGDRPVIYGDGSQTRDFIYVADAASAIVAALESEVVLSEGGGTGSAAYNISTGTETTVDALASHVRSLSGLTEGFERRPARDGDIVRSALDPGKALTVFGWHARIGVVQGLAQTWEWFAAQANSDDPRRAGR